jgi:hypothetical protein
MIVVAVSRDQVVDSWPIQPAVWLSIFSTISNLAFSSALATGVAVRFWLCAESGSRLGQLHYIWDHGRSLGFFAAFRAGSEARKVTLIATIAWIVQFASGPLLQRSTFQAAEDRVSEQVMFFDLSNRIPDGWMGRWDDARVRLLQHRRAITPIQEWFRNASITVPDKEGYRCRGTCHGFVRGAGFVHTCESGTESLDLSSDRANHSTVFLVETKLAEEAGEPFLHLTTKHIAELQGRCQATLHVHTCRIRAAVVEYPVMITNSTIVLRTDGLGSIREVSPYTAEGDRSTAVAGSGIGPLAGLHKFADDKLADNATVDFYHTLVPPRFLYRGPGMLADMFLQAEPPDSLNSSSLASCRLTWTSPTVYVLTAMHDYMFRVAHRVGNNTDRQTFTATRTETILVFRSDNAFLGGGLAVSFCALLLVASLSWGWWRLERPVTLSPLETARVFEGASELRGRVRRVATIDQILADVRHVQVRVGAADNPRDKMMTRVSVSTEERGPEAEAPGAARHQNQRLPF